MDPRAARMRPHPRLPAFCNEWRPKKHRRRTNRITEQNEMTVLPTGVQESWLELRKREFAQWTELTCNFNVRRCIGWCSSWPMGYQCQFAEILTLRQYGDFRLAAGLSDLNWNRAVFNEIHTVGCVTWMFVDSWEAIDQSSVHIFFFLAAGVHTLLNYSITFVVCFWYKCIGQIHSLIILGYRNESIFMLSAIFQPRRERERDAVNCTYL